jgi:hypothetical protein
LDFSPTNDFGPASFLFRPGLCDLPTSRSPFSSLGLLPSHPAHPSFGPTSRPRLAHHHLISFLASSSRAAYHRPKRRRAARRHRPPPPPPCSDEAESMRRLTFSVFPALTRRLIHSSPHFIAEIGRVKLHYWPPASRPLRSARRPIKGNPSTAAPHRTLSHSLLHLSVPPFAPHRAPTCCRFGPSSPASLHPRAAPLRPL